MSDPVEAATAALQVMQTRAAEHEVKLTEQEAQIVSLKRQLSEFMGASGGSFVPGPQGGSDAHERAMCVRNAAPNGLIRLVSRFNDRADDPTDNMYGLLDEPVRAPGEARSSAVDGRPEASEWQWELRRLVSEQRMVASAVRAVHHQQRHMPFQGDPTPQYSERIRRHLALAPAPIRDQVTRAFNDSSGAGSELMQDQRLPIFDDTSWRQDSGIEAMIPRISVATRQGTVPRIGDGIVAYIAGQATTADPAKFAASEPALGSVDYTVVRLAARIVLDADAVEDAYMAVVPLYIEAGLRAIGLISEHAIINGRTTGAQDGTSWNPAGIYGASVPALIGTAADPVRAWNGLRYDAIQSSNGGAGTDPATYATLLAAAGKVVGPHSRKRYLLGTQHQYKVSAIEQFATIDKMGPRASNIAGLVGGIGGIPVLASDLLTSDLNASGVYDGTTTTKTGYLCIDPTAYLMADRRATTVETVYDATRGIWHLVFTVRKVMLKQASASRKTARYDYNISPT